MKARLLQEIVRRERALKSRAQQHVHVSRVYASAYRNKPMSEQDIKDFLNTWRHITVCTGGVS